MRTTCTVRYALKINNLCRCAGYARFSAGIRKTSYAPAESTTSLYKCATFTL